MAPQFGGIVLDNGQCGLDVGGVLFQWWHPTYGGTLFCIGLADFGEILFDVVSKRCSEEGVVLKRRDFKWGNKSSRMCFTDASNLANAALKFSNLCIHRRFSIVGTNDYDFCLSRFTVAIICLRVRCMPSGEPSRKITLPVPSWAKFLMASVHMVKSK